MGLDQFLFVLCSPGWHNHGANIMCLPYENTSLQDLLQQLWSTVWINECSHLQITYREELQTRTIDGIMPKTLPQEQLRTRLKLSTEDLLKKKKTKTTKPKQTNKTNKQSKVKYLKVIAEKKIRYLFLVGNRRNQSQFSKTSQELSFLENILKELGFLSFNEVSFSQKNTPGSISTSQLWQWDDKKE